MSVALVVAYYLALALVYAAIFGSRPGHSWSGESVS